jgi:L-2-hydroxyglutarate oxidase LhgO
VTVAEADEAALAWLVALTVTEVVDVTVGAVRSPALDMDPAEADHVRAVLDEPLTVAVNC